VGLVEDSIQPTSGQIFFLSGELSRTITVNILPLNYLHGFKVLFMNVFIEDNQLTLKCFVLLLYRRSMKHYKNHFCPSDCKHSFRYNFHLISMKFCTLVRVFKSKIEFVWRENLTTA